ncbi:MAG: hypothetical protein M3552_20350, partial [Planctomycetota bacterium]|nr:hypothetical protein [Planctomycetota bacterium]
RVDYATGGAARSSQLKQNRRTPSSLRQNRSAARLLRSGTSLCYDGDEDGEAFRFLHSLAKALL